MIKEWKKLGICRKKKVERREFDKRRLCTEKKKEMYIKKEGFTSKKEGFIQLWKKEGNVHKKRRFYSVLKIKEGWKKKEG